MEIYELQQDYLAIREVQMPRHSWIECTGVSTMIVSEVNIDRFSPEGIRVPLIEQQPAFFLRSKIKAKEVSGGHWIRRTTGWDKNGNKTREEFTIIKKTA